MPPQRGNGATDVIALLKVDHTTVEQLFQEFEDAAAAEEDKARLVHEIVHELRVHSMVEQEVLYLVIREELDDGEQLADEAIQAHQEVEQLLAGVDAMAPTDEGFDAEMLTLIEDVRAHVEDEEANLLPRLEDALSLEQLEQIGRRYDEAKNTVQIS